MMTTIQTQSTRPATAFLSRVPWQRIFLSTFGIAVIQLQWRWAINHLYSLPPAAIGSFTNITNNSMYIIGALVIFFVTGKLFYDWKMNTVQTITQEARNVFEHQETENIVAPKHFDDPTIS